MHIALVSQWFPPDHYGGVAVYTAAMARAYVELGHRVTVITARSGPNQPPMENLNGVRIHRVNRWVEPYAVRHLPLVGRHARSVRHLIYSWTVCALLDRLAQRERIDIVEFAEVNAEGWFAALWGNRLPTVVRCHTPHVLLRRTTPPEERKFDTALIEQAEAAFVRRATAVTAPSADLAREIEHEMRLCPGRVTVIPNAIDVTTFSPGPGNGGASSGEPVTILYVGRLGREKGIFVLAEALAHLAARERAIHDGDLVPWRVIFVGEDRTDALGISNRVQLERFLVEHGLAGRVELRGFVPQEHLPDLYRSAGICVVPSLLYESFSYTCLQAMACGRPVVATAMGGIPEVVADGETGLLVPPGDAAALAGALGRLIDDAALRARLGRAGRERAERLYSDQAVAAQNLSLYADTIKGRALTGCDRDGTMVQQTVSRRCETVAPCGGELHGRGQR